MGGSSSNKPNKSNQIKGLACAMMPQARGGTCVEEEQRHKGCWLSVPSLVVVSCLSC